MKSNLFFITALALMVSCAKDGTQGPAGPQGLQGTSGANGAQGPQGPAGTNGTSNIKTIIDSVQPGNWSLTVSGSYFYTFSPVGILTNSDSDNVAVAVALTTGNTATWYSVPFTNLLSPGDQLEFAYSNYILNVIYNFSTPPLQELYFKITVTPPSSIKRKNIATQNLQN